jgi:hypothetical protein
MFLLTNKKYLALKELWKTEECKKTKGWGLFILALSSLIFFGISTYINHQLFLAH